MMKATVLVIEYERTKSGWKPSSVVAGNSRYDFDWCELDRVLAWHCSGVSGDTGTVYPLGTFCAAPKLCAKLWLAPSVQLTHDGKPITAKEARAFGYQILAEPLAGNPFDDPDVTEDDTEYCVQCEDQHPTERMCDHVQYEEGCGWILGCGAADVDFGATQASLYRMLRMMSPGQLQQLRNNVRDGSPVRDGQRRLEDFSDELEYEARYWPGIAWLASLDGPCPEARALTVGWIWAFQRASWRACQVVPEHMFIRHLPMVELDTWLALDPKDPTQLHEKPLRVELDFKSQTANDLAFLKDPERCHEVILWPNGDSKRSAASCGLTLSVADVRRVSAKAVDIYFGAIIEWNGKHVSEL